MSGTMVNAFDPTSAAGLPERTRDQLRRRDEVLGAGYRLFYREPLEVVRGEGVLLYDADGRDYLDAYNNVPSVGHCHPHVAQTVSNQLRTLNTNTRYLQESILSYSERLLATFPDALGNVMYTCSGSEANDLAVRVARYVTGHSGVIVTANTSSRTNASSTTPAPWGPT